MHDITASIVAYRDRPDLLEQTMKSFLDTAMDVKLYIIDNSPADDIRRLCMDPRVVYIFNNRNLGFGAGHNVAIRLAMTGSKYHLVLNPDIRFERGSLERCYEFMEKEGRAVGLLMPKICDESGAVQPLCKLLPAPLDLIIRRVDSRLLNRLFRTRAEKYVLKHTGYDKIMDVPHLSGCFMLMRREVFEKVGMFDERFFMYLEDVDLSRRIHRFFRTVYYPDVVAYHRHAKRSYRDVRALLYHTVSAVRYFNKWGWVFDRERRLINRAAMAGCGRALQGG